MLMSYQLRLLGVLNSLEKQNVGQTGKIDGQYALDNALLEDNYPTTGSRVLSVDAIDLVYKNPVISNVSLIEYWANNKDYDELAILIGKIKTAHQNNNGMLFSDYLKECTDVYNELGRYRDISRRPFDVEEKRTEVQYAYDTDGNLLESYPITTITNTSHSSIQLRNLPKASSSITWRTPLSDPINKSTEVTNEYEFTLSERVLETYGQSFLGEMKVNLDLRNSRRWYNGSFFQEDLISVTYNDPKTTVDYSGGSAVITMLPPVIPTNTPVYNPNNEIDQYINSTTNFFYMKFKELTLSDLIAFDPPPSTWL